MKLRPGTPKEAGMSPERVQHVRYLARSWVDDGVTPSLVVLAARRGVIVLHEAYGVMGPEPEAGPLKKDTIFPIASISKPITATAVMCLVEDGLVGLNRPVQWYIPEFVGEGKDAVMVHHLLTHTSGLAETEVDAHAERNRDRTVPAPESNQDATVHEYLTLWYDAPLSRPPGEEMSYCAHGYEILGEIIRRVSSRSFADFTRERIFDPLGMKDTWWSVPASARPRLVRRADDAPSAALFNEIKITETAWACGGACSTAGDLAAYGQMFLNHGTCGQSRVLSPAAVDAMTRNQIPHIGAWAAGQFLPEASWGLGWSVRGTKKLLDSAQILLSPRALCHTGLGGVCLWVDPSHQLVATYLSVFSAGGLPEHVNVTDMSPFGIEGRMDLFVNAVLSAISDEGET